VTTPVLLFIAILLVAVTAALWFGRERLRGRAVPRVLRPGNPLPEFEALDEQGNTVHSTDLRGSPAVLLFVRGNWCPFCSRQVANLTTHYREIGDLGASLILITPKPLQTTRRVAEFFDVDFDYWLDDNLTIARQLGLLLAGGVPGEHREDYGPDTVWPTSLVVDANGVIRYAKLSRFIADRPDAGTLVARLRTL
jgi:peroxiredoxin